MHPELAAIAVRLRRFGLILQPARKWGGPSRASVRGRGLFGVLSLRGRWPEDPSPCLYLSRADDWDRMANATFCGEVPATNSALRALVRRLRTRTRTKKAP